MSLAEHSTGTASAENTDDGGLKIVLAGDWLKELPTVSASSFFEQVTGTEKLFVDAKDVGSWDSSLINFLLPLHRLSEQRDIALAYDLPSGAEQLLILATSVPAASSAEKSAGGPLQALLTFFSLRRTGTAIGGELLGLAEFVGGLVAAMLKMLVGGARIRFGDVLRFSEQTGPNALPIISLSSFLVGMILGYLGAVQLQQFGAGIYVANLVTIGVLREMGPLMTAIILAGRTGAAYAAQLGTMRVNEEIDAIEILGITPMEFLVLPRVLAIILVLPLLTLFANVLGILGGGIVASGLGITPLQYWTQVQGSFAMDHLTIGLVKAVIFGALIGLAGCRSGLKAGRDSEGVGQATTQAVVSALVYLIVADALVNIFCQLFNI